MKKSTKGVIIGISLVTIAVGIFNLVRGKEFMDTLPTFLIGLSLWASIYFDKKSDPQD